ncbi:Tfp pilus assembly protein FimT [Legionella bozemanae]|uniref:Type II secretion system protein H n=2 Tax=Legionella bozemanae TaxID=447 RepID=A0A0W0RR11_LEGBO|nr:type II secretory pathway protein LspH [Legionella bozemanae]STO34220.1 Tfp pilus assembly protein FimT [Legionella bozemanae]
MPKLVTGMRKNNRLLQKLATEREARGDMEHRTASYMQYKDSSTESTQQFSSVAKVPKRSNQGFTLIEILIVLVIIGITFGFALLAFGDFGESRRILFSAEQLVNTLRLAQQQAILGTNTLGLRIDNNGYQVFQLYNNAQWKPISDKGVFKMTYFPQDTRIILKTSNSTPAGVPPVIIFASGDMTPFTLSFGSKQDNNLALLIGKRNGELQFNVVNTK